MAIAEAAMRVLRGFLLPTVLSVCTLFSSALFAQPSRIRIGGNVQQARLVKRINPEYPPLARQARIQGTVRLQVVIGRDGTIQQVEVISGHPLLVQPSLDAVRQWQYKPTLLNGEPVEVLTTVDVVFTLTIDPGDSGAGSAAETPSSSNQPSTPSAVLGSPELFRANRMVGEHMIDGAIILLRNAIRLEPEDLSLRLGLARILLRNKRDVVGAIREYSDTFSRSNSLSACRDLAEAYREVYDLDAAIRQYRTCLSLDPADERSWLDLSQAAYEKGDAQTATLALRDAIAIHPQPAQLHAKFADYLAKSWRPAAALQQAREAVRLNPDDQQALGLLDRLLRDRAEGELQVARLRGFLSRNPNSIPAWSRLASALFLYLDDADGAISAYRECIDREPNRLEHYQALTRLVGRREGMQAAIREAKNYVSVYPNSPGARLAFASLLLQSGDVQQALRESERAVALDPENPLAHQVRAMALAAFGDPGAARQEWDQMKTMTAARPSPRREVDPELEAYLRTGEQPTEAEANEISAVGALRTINTACVQYHVTYGAGFPPALASLGPGMPASAQQADLIDAALASGVKNGYLFTYITGPSDEQGRVVSFEVHADPLMPGSTGNRYFFTDQSGVIRVNTGGRASVASPPIQ